VGGGGWWVVGGGWWVVVTRVSPMVLLLPLQRLESGLSQNHLVEFPRCQRQQQDASLIFYPEEQLKSRKIQTT